MFFEKGLEVAPVEDTACKKDEMGGERSGRSHITQQSASHDARNLCLGT